MSSSSPNDPELDALLGAYALDALESSEREDVDAYLAENARARFEVDELRESAAALAMAPVDDATAPPELWERIARTIDTEAAGDTGPGADLSDDDLAARRAEHSDRRGYWMSLVAAAAAIVALALVAQVISLSRRLDSEHGAGEKATVAAFDRAQHATGARQVSLTAAHGAEVARVVLLPDGSGYLKNEGVHVPVVGVDRQPRPAGGHLRRGARPRSGGRRLPGLDRRQGLRPHGRACRRGGAVDAAAVRERDDVTWPSASMSISRSARRGATTATSRPGPIAAT